MSFIICLFNPYFSFYNKPNNDFINFLAFFFSFQNMAELRYEKKITQLGFLRFIKFNVFTNSLVLLTAGFKEIKINASP